MAIAYDPEMASSLGANTLFFAIFAFAFAGVLAGVAGVLIGPITYSNPYLGDTYGIAGFVALMIAGTERPAAAMVGGLLLGVLGEAANKLINTQASDWFPFVVVVFILLLMPDGLFSAGSRLWTQARGMQAGPGGSVVTAGDLAGQRPAISSAATAWRPIAYGGALVAYLALTYWLAHGTLYVQGLTVVAAVFGMLAVSLDLVAGMLGLYSLGHAGLFAIGAYTTTLLYNDRGWSIWVLLPVCIVGVGVVGFLLGSLTLRVSGLYFAITTFVFTLVLTVVASDSAFTGGYGGLIGPLFPTFSGRFSWLGDSLTWCCMVGLLVAMLIALGIRHSPFYPVLLATRDAEPFAAAAGAKTALVKIGMFGLSAAMAGAAGWIFAFQGIVSPGQFNWTVSVNILVMVILGGINTTLGPVLGAAFVTIFPAQVNINPYWQEVIFGLLFVLVVVIYPTGFVGLVRAVFGRVLGWVRPGVAPQTLTRSRAGPSDEPAPVEIEAVEAAAREGVQNEATPPPVEITGATVPAVRCRGVVFGYLKQTRVLNGVDFEVERGTIHGLIGPERIREEHARRSHRWSPETAIRHDRNRREPARSRRAAGEGA